MKLENLNEASPEEFVSVLDGIFEHSPWVAKAATSARPFGSLQNLHELMANIVDTSGLERQLKLIRAHPDLAGKAALAGNLTAESTNEQAGAGLDRLSDEEYRLFHNLNDDYQSKFGFPFIIAVKGHTKHSILDAFQKRLKNDSAAERQEALRQIYRIAQFRLEELITI